MLLELQSFIIQLLDIFHELISKVIYFKENIWQHVDKKSF